jgi:hypothetical protein
MNYIAVKLHARQPMTIIGVGIVLCALPAMRAAEVNETAPLKFSREQVEFYEKQVQPILSSECYQCHSHEADKIKGGFVLDSREGLLKGGDDGVAIVPGEPDKSLLIKAVRHGDEDLKMPPKKQLTDEQIAVLVQWVKMGAPYGEMKAAAVAAGKGRKITAEDRNWWSFQPVRAVKMPEVTDGGWARTPIDKFIFAKLQAAGLQPAPEADKPTLIRRVYFDVIGLPPTAEEVERFVTDPAPDAYEKVVDGLLKNPAYGEKWARHWLDLVRYAESDGYKSDSFRPLAWRYRDYVIRSLNDDKPYDRFLMEQIAADELWPDDPEAMLGLNYLRLWIYEYNQRNVKAQWATILNDITDVTGDAMLGLGMQCARCHDHKFDPILQRDYFRLQAFFAAISPQNEAVGTPEEMKAYRAQLAEWEQKTADLRAKIDAIEEPFRDKTAKGVIDKFPKEIQAIMNKPASERSPYEQQINDLAYRQVEEEFEKLDGKFRGSDRQRLEQLRDELAKYDELKPRPLPEAMVVKDIRATAPPVAIPKDKSQTPIEPGFLTLLGDAPAVIEQSKAANSTGRRAALAKWLGRPDNQFTTRVIVNRIWQQHFGPGLVSTPSDFGHLGALPSHPELLDWLAKYFVEHHWSMKELHRLILTSATYRQASRAEGAVRKETLPTIPPPHEPPVADALPTIPPLPFGRGEGRGEGSVLDPDNHLLWRQNMRRLESDQVRDAMLWASGELDSKAGGPSVDASKPRRTIYTKWLRNSRDPLLEAFDPPDPYTSTPQRNVTTTPMQSLTMINGGYVLQRAQALAERVKRNSNNQAPSSREAPNSKLQINPVSAQTLAATPPLPFGRGDGRGEGSAGSTRPDAAAKSQPADSNDNENLVGTAYRFVFGREPSDAEKAQGTAFLKEQSDRIRKKGTGMAPMAVEPMPKRSGTAAAFHADRGQMRMQVPDNHLMPQYDFTIEAFLVLRSADSGGAVRTIVSRWDGRKDQPGWSFGVAGIRGREAPVGGGAPGPPGQTLILELIGDPAEDGTGGYEAISSRLRIDLDTPYFVAVSVRIGDTSDSGVTFFVKELTAGAPLQTDHLAHKVTANHQSNLPLIIGARDPEKHVAWDGLIDDVRLSNRTLKEQELLLARESAGEGTVGYWRFEEPDFFKDSSPNGHNIKSEVSPGAQADAQSAALIDFCHVLLNSNEFLYVD